MMNEFTERGEPMFIIALINKGQLHASTFATDLAMMKTTVGNWYNDWHGEHRNEGYIAVEHTETAGEEAELFAHVNLDESADEVHRLLTKFKEPIEG